MNCEKILKNVIIERFKCMKIFSNIHEVEFLEEEKRTTVHKFVIKYTDGCLVDGTRKSCFCSMNGTVNDKGVIRFDVKTELILQEIGG